jgi:hypothetical protein
VEEIMSPVIVVSPSGARRLGIHPDILSAMIHLGRYPIGAKVLRVPDGEVLCVRVSRDLYFPRAFFTTGTSGFRALPDLATVHCAGAA